jgi:hypothetical protein
LLYFCKWFYVFHRLILIIWFVGIVMCKLYYNWQHHFDGWLCIYILIYFIYILLHIRCVYAEHTMTRWQVLYLVVMYQLTDQWMQLNWLVDWLKKRIKGGILMWFVFQCGTRVHSDDDSKFTCINSYCNNGCIQVVISLRRPLDWFYSNLGFDMFYIWRRHRQM